MVHAQMTTNPTQIHPIHIQLHCLFAKLLIITVGLLLRCVFAAAPITPIALAPGGVLAYFVLLFCTSTFWTFHPPILPTLSPLPYLTGYTDDVEKALFLRRFDVPFWALTYVFGRNDDYWYRQENQFGRYDLVRTVVKDPERTTRPCIGRRKDHLAEWRRSRGRHHRRRRLHFGRFGCAGVQNTENLTEAYQHFNQEAQALKPGYMPETVNTDGWNATQRAWLNLFPMIIIIECFLHASSKSATAPNT